MYRRIVLAALLVAGATHASLAAQDPARCRELTRKYETGRAQFSAVEVSLMLFSDGDLTERQLLQDCSGNVFAAQHEKCLHA